MEFRSLLHIKHLLDEFGYANPACDIFRFREPGFPILVEGAVVLSLVIRCSGRVLVFFGSFGPRGVVNFNLDRSALGLSADARATDAESGAVVAITGQNFTFGVDKHSFRIVVIADEDFHFNGVSSTLKRNDEHTRLKNDDYDLDEDDDGRVHERPVRYATIWAPVQVIVDPSDVQPGLPVSPVFVDQFLRRMAIWHCESSG